MKLTKSTTRTVLNATRLASILQIEGLIFDKDGIRGYNDVDGVILAALEDFEFEFDALGVAGLQSLKNKLSMFSDADNLTVEAVPKKNNDDVIERLHFESGKIDFDYRCALPKTINDIPKKNLNKTALFWFTVTEEDVAAITKATSSMRSPNMTIQGTEKVLRIRFSDDIGNIMNYKLDTDLNIEGDDEAMSLTVNVKKLLPILKLAVRGGDFRLNILKNNIVYVTVDGLDLFVMAEV